MKVENSRALILAATARAVVVIEKTVSTNNRKLNSLLAGASAKSTPAGSEFKTD